MPQTTTLLDHLTDARGEPLGTLKVTTTVYRLRTWHPSRGSALLTGPDRRVLARAKLTGDGWRLLSTGIPDPSLMDGLRSALRRAAAVDDEPVGLRCLVRKLTDTLQERSTGKVWRLSTSDGQRYYSTAGEDALREAVGKPGTVDFVLEDTLGADAVFTDVPAVSTRSSLTG